VGASYSGLYEEGEVEHINVTPVPGNMERLFSNSTPPNFSRWCFLGLIWGCWHGGCAVTLAMGLCMWSGYQWGGY